ncbi:ubiquitin carboxyl-terminal hydrolase YUH1 [Kluyveromyces marxianus]|nr:ubiquitin carboxyl-terminal hydrolase YUH1 [Kluyveromyces marxianus]
MSEQEVKSVIPLESNPEVFGGFAKSLGLHDAWTFQDIYSLVDPDLLAFVPRPVKAVILLFPLSEESEKELTEKPEAEAVLQDPSNSTNKNYPIWFKQTVRNACGLYALLHSLSNNQDLLTEDSILKQFLTSNPVPHGKYSNNEALDNFIVSISEIYHERSLQGDTAAPPAENEVELHFITFVEKDGVLYELDGRNSSGAKPLGKTVAAESNGEPDLLNEPLLKERFEWYHNNASESMKLQFSLLGLGPSLN